MDHAPWEIRGGLRRQRLLTTGHNKADPELGFSALASDVEFGRVRFPNGDAAGRAITTRFIDEATNWTTPKDIDDQLLALWFIKNNAKSLRPPHIVHRKAVNRAGWAAPSWVAEGWSQRPAHAVTGRW